MNSETTSGSTHPSASPTSATAANTATNTATNTANTMNMTSSADAERLQGERFVELSQRCHQQHWSQVHTLAQQILSHCRENESNTNNNSNNNNNNSVDNDNNGTTGSSGTVKRSSEGGNSIGSDGNTSNKNNSSSSNNNNNTDGSNPLPMKRAAREGTVSISGKIIHIDAMDYDQPDNGGGTTEGADAAAAAAATTTNGGNNNESQSNNNTALVEQSLAAIGSDGNDDNIATDNATATNTTTNTATTMTTVNNNQTNANNNNNNNNTSTNNQTNNILLPPTTTYPTQPRMLSTCLGTASPLAWTCRYSAPSSTVKLVLDLDVASVRRCLPQLGTPLHECVGRPRPLRKAPLKRGSWTRVNGGGADANAAAGSTTTTNTTTTGTKNTNTAKKPKGSQRGLLSSNNNTHNRKLSKRRKQYKRNTPRILVGLREWRRTVRTLIQADESLSKEVATVPDGHGNGNAATTAIGNNGNANGGTHHSTTAAAAVAATAAANQEKRHYPIRATLAQDADGNTPLHFMIRRAAAPAFGGGRWQSRHEVDEEDDEEEEEEVEEVEDDSAMSVDAENGGEIVVDGVASSSSSSNPLTNTATATDMDHDAGERATAATAATTATPTNTIRNNRDNDPRHIEYWGTSGSSWDGVRWCMEAHLRRVERRIARQKKWEEKHKYAGIGGGGGGSFDEDDYMSSGEKGVARGVASVCLNNSSSFNYTNNDVNMTEAHPEKGEQLFETTTTTAKKVFSGTDSSDASACSDQKLPAKRKTSDMETEPLEEERSPKVLLHPTTSTSAALFYERGKSKPRRRKYLDSDERQDCCYDPLLGVVRDLVHSCPEAVGVPDHREYEETPLIVALKSSIYVVMEPDDDFQIPVADGIALLGQRGLDGPGGGGLRNAVLGVGGGFPFLELGAFLPHRPFGFFPDDESMMAVLRGHGRRVEQQRTRRSAAQNLAQRLGVDVSGGRHRIGGRGEDGGDDDSSYSSVSDHDSFDGEDDPRYDAFVPCASEQVPPAGNTPVPGQFGMQPQRRIRYDYQTALEYRIFCLVQIMLDAYPRAACLMISDYTPLHSAVFHGRCTDIIRLLLHAEERFYATAHSGNVSESAAASSSNLPPTFERCPVLSGPAMLCTNTRGELPLHFACMRNESARSIQLLGEADPRAALVRDAAGRTPLRWLWVRFVDGLLDRFGGRDAQTEEDGSQLAFQDQEGGNTGNFPRPNQNALSANTTGMRDGDDFMNDVFNIGSHKTKSNTSTGGIFKFDTEYIRRTRLIDRTVDFLRMRHVPSGFESIENVAAEHAITVLLKLKYLQERRKRQFESKSTTHNSESGNVAPPEVTMTIKEEFILLAFKKFTALIYAAFTASEAEKTETAASAFRKKQRRDSKGANVDAKSEEQLPSRKIVWQFLPQVKDKRRFLLLHEACGSPRASCPAAVAKICMRLYSDQLFQLDDDGRLPLHRAACRGLGWEPPGSLDVTQASLASETLDLLKEVLEASHTMAPRTYDKIYQLPLHCAIDSLVTSLLLGKSRRASLHAEARAALQSYRHTHVEIAIECLSVLLQAHSNALERRDGRTRLYPFMQAASVCPCEGEVVKYTTDLSLGTGGNVGTGLFNSTQREVVEEDDSERDTDHLTIIYFLFRENPSIISSTVQ